MKGCLIGLFYREILRVKYASVSQADAWPQVTAVICLERGR